MCVCVCVCVCARARARAAQCMCLGRCSQCVCVCGVCGGGDAGAAEDVCLDWSVLQTLDLTHSISATDYDLASSTH